MLYAPCCWRIWNRRIWKWNWYDSSYKCWNTLLSKEQYTDYKKYFNKELKTVEQEIGTEKDVASGFDPKPYIEKGYYYGYEVGDGFGTSNIEYQLETISKVDNHYEAIINATRPKESSEEIKRPASPNYKGVLKVEVVGNYLKYNELIFKKV